MKKIEETVKNGILIFTLFLLAGCMTMKNQESEEVMAEKKDFAIYFWC